MAGPRRPLDPGPACGSPQLGRRHCAASFPLAALTRQGSTASQKGDVGTVPLEPKVTITNDPLPARRRLAGALPAPAATLGLLSLLLGLIAVVALASRGHRTPGGGAARGPSGAFWDYVFTLSILAALAGLVISLYLIKPRLDAQVGQRDPKGRYLLVITFCASLVLGAILAAQLVRGDPDRVRTPEGRGGGSETQRRLVRDPDEQRPDFKWGAAIAFGSIGLAALAYASTRRRVRQRLTAESDDEALAEELAALLDATLDDLRAEPDPRRAVIAAYARMERALAAYGLPRHPFEAPLEFLERASPELAGPHPGGLRLVFELTHLFERAKFSQHAVDEEMKRDAIASLEALRADLRGAVP